MIEIFTKISPLILDVIVVSAIVLIVFFGVIKSVKKTSIDFFVLLISLFLGFGPYTKSLKSVITSKIVSVSNFIPAGTNNISKFIFTLFNQLVAALVIFLLFYILIHLIIFLFGVIRKRKVSNQKCKSKVGRIFGGILSFVYQGSILVVVLLFLNTNIVGMKESIDDTKITNFIISKTTQLVDKISVNGTDELIVKVLKGDILSKSDEDVMNSINYIENKAFEIASNDKYMELLNNDELKPEEVKDMIRNRIIDLYNLAIISNDFDNNDEKVKEAFVKTGEEWITLMNRKYTNMGLEKIEFNVNELGMIRIEFNDAGIGTQFLSLFDEMVVGK